jgi:hypothetical protein
VPTLSTHRHEPVLRPEAVLGPVGGDAPLGDGPLGLLQDVRQVFGVDVVEHVHRTDGLGGVVAEHPSEGGVSVPQGAVGVDHGDDLRGALHHRAQPPVVLPRCPVGMPEPVAAASGPDT